MSCNKNVKAEIASLSLCSSSVMKHQWYGFSGLTANTTSKTTGLDDLTDKSNNKELLLFHSNLVFTTVGGAGVFQSCFVVL